MSEFKCISCGEIKQSETICSCPVCGYSMFKMPYDKKNILISEIQRFFSSLEVKSVDKNSFLYEGKEKDDNRFPDYDKILKYVSSKDRTEDFLNNLIETAEQLKIHFTSEFSNIYPVSFEYLDSRIAQYDNVLIAALKIISPDDSIELETIKWPELSLFYSENQNKYLWSSANELIDLIKKLAKKIVKFIKVNNLFGNIHKYHPSKYYDKINDDTDYKDLLEDAIILTEIIIKKKYIIDIVDDGSDELKEMLTCLWHGIELIMSVPLITKTYNYKIECDIISEHELFDYINEILKCRYSDIDDLISINSLETKTETELFEIYKKLIDIDKYGFLVSAGTKLFNVGQSEKKLRQLVGLNGIKESIQKIKAYALTNKDSDNLNIHMCFLGNPGTGKTEVARYIADILYENKILPTNNIVEVDRSGLVSEYYGATAEKTCRVIERAMGGVLFVDEAYALCNDTDSGQSDYGKEAVDTLVKAMEDYRGKFCLILAGYKNEMLKMISSNPGFSSRIQFMLDFPNYSRDELMNIAYLMLKKRNYTIGELAMNRILDITDIKRKDPNFANAREIRNILDQVIMCQNLRCVGSVDSELGIIDVNNYIQNAKINLPINVNKDDYKVLSGEEELDQLIGLNTVKRMIKKIKAYAKRNKGEADFNLHMCFYGNPGTGKTEVARILSRIFYDTGVLGEAKLVETDAHGLIGKYVGESAPKTLAKINEAMNGTLFIDEAYGLIGSCTSDGKISNYGDEAIAVLLKEMEDKRGQFCVILAGYKEEMQSMISTNPGLQSRIQFTLEFPDYSKAELGAILEKFLSKKKYMITKDAKDKFLDITDYFRKKPNFANARTVRNILDQVIMNQNLRTEDTDGDNLIIIEDVIDYITDENIDLSKADNVTGNIGFI